MNIDPIIKSHEDLLQEKKSHRRAMAAKPVEEKLEALIQLQRISSTLARQAGRPYQEPWDIEQNKKAHLT